MELTEYFKSLYDKMECHWNVESSLEYFGDGESNEGTDESRVIKRYYVKPYNKIFDEIYLNFNKKRNIESIVWFFGGERLNIAQLKELFGPFKIQNIIYDETTELVFSPKDNTAVKSITSSIFEWVEKRPDGTLYFNKLGEKINITNDYDVTNVTFHMNTI